jgi:ubiquinone/menaquinone biosynthesis C-methylase UbiE
MADWDNFSELYDGVFTEDPVYIGMLSLMGELIEEAGGSRVLDLGCGTGNLTAVALDHLDQASIVAVDPSDGMRKTCSARFAGEARVEVVAGSAASIPGPDGVFDLVISSLALHHIPVGEKGAVARELARVVAPGGKLLYMDVFVDVEGGPPDPLWCRDVIDKTVAWALCSLEAGAYRHMNILLRTLVYCLEQDGEYLVTPDSWRGMLADSGFTMMDSFNVEPEPCGLKVLRATRS